MPWVGASGSAVGHGSPHPGVGGSSAIVEINVVCSARRSNGALAFANLRYLVAPMEISKNSFE
jgi:hypothetical protein